MQTLCVPAVHYIQLPEALLDLVTDVTNLPPIMGRPARRLGAGDGEREPPDDGDDDDADDTDDSLDDERLDELLLLPPRVARSCSR